MGADFLHASAPSGCKCADCTLDDVPCPLCYTVGWKKKHPNTLQIYQNSSDAPLNCAIEGEAVIIRIGIGMLAHGAEAIPDVYDQRNEIKICNKIEFAKGVVQQLCHEDETGASMLTKLFDEASIAAWEEGSLGCRE